MALAIDAGERGDDVVGSVSDQGGVVIGGEDAVVHKEVEKVGHLFEVGRNVGVIAGEMDVIELNVNDVFDFTTRRLERALTSYAGRCGREREDEGYTRSEQFAAETSEDMRGSCNKLEGPRELAVHEESS
jgi:hypothetical protein